MNTRYQVWRVLSVIFLAASLIPICQSFGEDSGDDLEEETWQATRDFLFNREYGLAINYLENCAKDERFQKHAESIRKDIDAVAKLQQIAESVEAAFDSMAVGAKLLDGNRELTFVGIDKQPAGKSLKFKTSTGREVQTTQWKLRSSTWLKLVENVDDSPAKDELTVAIFLGFDRIPNRDGASRKLNSAAASGVDVGVWVQRLKQNLNHPHTRKVNVGVNRELLGTWRINFQGKKYDGEVTFRRRGKTSARRIPSWKKVDEGVFELTFARNQKAKFETELTVFENRFWGKDWRGNPFSGVRIK